MNTARRLIIITCMAPMAAMLVAQTTILDPGFADGGVLVSPNTNTLNYQETHGILEMSDGYYLGLGSKEVDLGSPDIRTTLMKYDLCGVPDSTFGTNGLSTIQHAGGTFVSIVSAQELPDGKILCAANYSTGGVSTARPALFRLLPDGSLDETYGTDGLLLVQVQNPPTSSGNFGNTIKIAGDTIIASIGRFPNINGGLSGVGLMRILPDGTPDVSFGPGGALVYAFAGMGYSQARWERVHLKNDSIYWLTRAESQDLGATYNPVIYAFDTSGTVRMEFGIDGRLQDPTLVSGALGRSVESTLDTEGRLVITVAQAQFVDGVMVYRMVFMRYLANGTLDTGFGDNGYTTIASDIPNTQTHWPSTLGVNADGTIRATFVHGLGTGATATSMLQLDADGALVPGGNVPLPHANTGITALIRIDEDRWLAQAFGNAPAKHQSQLRFSDIPVMLPAIELTGSDLNTTGSGPDLQWYLNSEAISGATDALYTPVTNGSYTVEMTDELGCVHASEPYMLLNVGISEATSNGLQVINTLALEQLFVRNDGSPVPYELLSIGGQRLATGQLVQGMNTLNVSHLAQGVYLLRAVNADGPAVHRFVKY